jgi:hypothetical protein
MDTADKVFLIVFGTIGTTLVIALAWLLLFMLPVSLRAEKRCLEMGYPKTEVAYNGDAYCVNLEGAVTNRVRPLP